MDCQQKFASSLKNNNSYSFFNKLFVSDSIKNSFLVDLKNQKICCYLNLLFTIFIFSTCYLVMLVSTNNNNNKEIE